MGPERLGPGEVNVGYALHPDHRGKGYATRAVKLLLEHLKTTTTIRYATLAIDHDNVKSLAVAERTSFERVDDLPDAAHFKREVNPPVLADGVITLRRPTPLDREPLLAQQDEQFVRFMGGGGEPNPMFCVTVEGRVVGWVDFDRDQRTWLTHDDVNIGYGLHPDFRGKGYATRGVMLLLHHLAQDTDVRTATLLIDKENEWSLRLPARAGFTDAGTIGDNGARFFTKRVPPLTYTDGTVTIRPFRLGDLDRDHEGKDEEQITWVWLPGERETWEAMSPEEQRAHTRRHIETRLEDPRNGPKWSFVIDVAGRYVGAIDCDLANRNVPHGEANIGYVSHPDERGKGYVSRAVRLVVQFLREHTGASQAQIGVDERNEPSLRVARAVGAVEFERAGGGVRHRISLR